jgi:TolB-like protein/Tfp pilus assembly protein PilF
MFTDIVGYTTLGQRNESLSLLLVEEQRKLVRPILRRHNGREVKTIGDAFLVEFASALEAVNCAIEIQTVLREVMRSSPEERKFNIRIGIHLGDVVHQGRDVAGDAVNVASRIEPLSPPGGVCVSAQVYHSVVNKVEYEFESLGVPELKNVTDQMEVYRIAGLGEKTSKFEPRKAIPVKNRIAVLPFTNISPSKEDEYFADGMTEELISTMSRISGLSVIARTSVMGYKGGQKKIDEISRELGVGTVLEGSVRKAGNKLRVTVQLINCLTSDHLWSESYDRDLSDAFAVQCDISKTVADALKVKLLSKETTRLERVQTVNPEAYDLYLKGRFYWNERTRESVNKAIRFFEQSVGVDSGLALAYSGLADCYNILADYDWMTPDRAGPIALEYARKALQVDDGLAEAHASLALTLMNYSWDFDSAERELKTAIELRPNYSPAHHWYAVLLFYLRRNWGDSYEQEKLAMDLDPHSRVIKMGLAASMARLGRTEEALLQFEKLIEQSPDFAAARVWKSTVHLWRFEYDAAIEEARKAVELDKTSFTQLSLAEILALSGRKDEAQRILDDVLKEAGDSQVLPVYVGEVEFALGRWDEGFKWLEKGLAVRDVGLLYFGSTPNPSYEKYRSDPRWKEIDAKIGPTRRL